MPVRAQCDRCPNDGTVYLITVNGQTRESVLCTDHDPDIRKAFLDGRPHRATARRGLAGLEDRIAAG